MRGPFRGVIVDGGDPAFLIVLDPVDDGIGDEPGARCLRAIRRQAAVKLGVDGHMGWQLFAPQQAGRPS